MKTMNALDKQKKIAADTLRDIKLIAESTIEQISQCDNEAEIGKFIDMFKLDVTRMGEFKGSNLVARNVTLCRACAYRDNPSKDEKVYTCKYFDKEVKATDFCSKGI